MLYASRYNNAFAGVQGYYFVAQVHLKATTYHQEELIFVIMMVPVELAFKLCEFNLLPVQITNNARIPEIWYLTEFICQTYFVYWLHRMLIKII